MEDGRGCCCQLPKVSTADLSKINRRKLLDAFAELKLRVPSPFAYIYRTDNECTLFDTLRLLEGQNQLLERRTQLLVTLPLSVFKAGIKSKELKI